MSHGPRHAGLFRGINDFRRALDAPILSFDSIGKRAPEWGCGSNGTHRIACGRAWLARTGLVIGREASAKAETLLGDADLAIVHSLFRGHAGWAMKWAARSSRRYWAVPHGCLDPWGLAQRRVAKRLWMAAVGDRFLQDAKRVIFATTRERDKALATVAGIHSSVVPWPVEAPLLTDRESDRHEWRREMRIADEARVLVSVSRLHTMKRPLALLDAYTAAGAPGCTLVVVGGEDDLSIAELQRRLPSGSRSTVYFTGRLDQHDLQRVMHASDGFISLSHRENFGYSVADALVHGLPVILTPGHDLAYDMPRRGDGRLDFGWLLPDLSQHAAAMAIREFADASPDWLTKAGMRARAWAAEELSPDRFASTLGGLA
jgi:glycosyltransferase involved in cell wall biosynthesis